MKLSIEHIKTFLLTVAPGNIFHRDDIGKHYQIQEFENKDYLRKALFDLVQAKVIAREGKRDGLFRKLDSQIDEMPWLDADPEETIPLIFPYGIEDNSSFGLERCVQIYPKDIIVIAGVSNMGKTTFALNLLVNNLELSKREQRGTPPLPSLVPQDPSPSPPTPPNTLVGASVASPLTLAQEPPTPGHVSYQKKYPVVYFTNEFSPAKFHERISHFNWIDLLDEKDKPRFRVVERYDNFEDVINPDALNIIDWIELTGESGQEFYRIGGILKHIQEKLNKGICVAVLQKKQHPNVKAGQQDLGVGGEASLRRAALYINIDYQKLTVKKCKSWTETNPNGRSWRFDIIEHGSRFHRIEPLEEVKENIPSKIY